MLTADQTRLAAEQTVTTLKMRRRDLQIGLIKALGGGFDATQTGLVVPTGEHGPAPAAATPAATTAAK